MRHHNLKSKEKIYTRLRRRPRQRIWQMLAGVCIH